MDNLEAKSHIINNNEDTQGDLAQIAEKLYAEKDYEKALKMYTEALLYTTNSDLYVKMGNCLDKLGKSDTAIEYWQKAIDIDSSNSDAFINLGNHYYTKNKIEMAISNWMAALVSMPEEPTANLNLAVAYTLKKMTINAFKYYNRYLKYAQDKTSEKYKEIQHQIERNKKLANDYLKLGVQYQASKDKLSALKCYKRAGQYYPNFSKIHLNIGSLYFADQNYEEAAKYWTKAMYLDPIYPKTISNLAICHDMLKQFDYAYCYYTIFASFIINQPAEYSKVVTRCHKIKPYLNDNPLLAENHIIAAKKAFANCDYDRAISEFKNYIILKPQEQDVYFEMVKKLEQYLNPERTMINICNDKGIKLMGQHKFKEAQKYFARILVLADSGTPDYANARRKFGICLQNS